MSFDKAYPNRKDHRQEYKDSKQFDRTCRSHGSCAHCAAQRQYKIDKAIKRVEPYIM